MSRSCSSVRGAAIVVGLCIPLAAVGQSWLDSVAPIISKDERQSYLQLADDPARRAFETEFWKDKRISASEYFARLRYIDGTYGSGKVGSGANTDQGRVYLTLGPPVSVHRLPSSRIFVPCEVWYYDHAPELGYSSRIALMFYRPRESGSFRLYSPWLDTIRALLLPGGSTRSLFNPNEVILPEDIRSRLNVSPSENPIVEAAIGVAQGVQTTGNDAIINLALAPARVLRRDFKEDVQSQFLVPAPDLYSFATWTADGVPVVDLLVRVSARSAIGLTVQKAGATVSETETALDFTEAARFSYLHRLFLLPGDYTLVVTADGTRTPFPLRVSSRQSSSEILIGSAQSLSGRTMTPFQFGSSQIRPFGKPDTAVVQIATESGALTEVPWRIRVAGRIASRGVDPALRGILTLNLPETTPGQRTELEVDAGGQTRKALIAANDETPIVVSYNANLGPGAEWLAMGQQHLLEGSHSKAVASFRRAPESPDTLAGLGKAEALRGELDAARRYLEAALRLNPDHFDALSTMGYVEVQFQDFEVAVDFYKRALAIRPHPALTEALALAEGLRDEHAKKILIDNFSNAPNN